MTWNERAFLCAVLAVAMVFAAVCVSHVRGTVETAVGVRSGGGGAARDLNEELVRRLIEGGHLSGHEAMHYERVGPPQ